MTSTPVQDNPNAGGAQGMTPAVDFINKFLLCQAYLHSAVKLKKVKESAPVNSEEWMHAPIDFSS